MAAPSILNAQATPCSLHLAPCFGFKKVVYLRAWRDFCRYRCFPSSWYPPLNCISWSSCHWWWSISRSTGRKTKTWPYGPFFACITIMPQNRMRIMPRTWPFRLKQTTAWSMRRLLILFLLLFTFLQRRKLTLHPCSLSHLMSSISALLSSPISGSRQNPVNSIFEVMMVTNTCCVGACMHLSTNQIWITRFYYAY